MNTKEVELRKELIDVAQRSERIGLIIYTQGNFSARIPDTDHILITPSNIPYNGMQPEDIVVVDLDGNKVDGIYEPSSETRIHTMAYRTRSWVGGCAHTESPYINVLYAMNKEIPNILGNFVYLFGGKGLAVAPSLKSATEKFAEETLDAMGDHLGVVWKNHGLFCVGPDIELAFKRCWTAEDAARVYYLALTLQAGEPDLIPQDVQEEMIEVARKWGLTPTAI